MKYFKIKKKINEKKIKSFFKIVINPKKPVFPRKVFWDVKDD